MQAICVEAAFFFFYQLYLLYFHIPTPAVPTAPTCTGQQEIGIQCFLDGFPKEMNFSQKMRTMNNGMLDGMCLTHAIHTTWVRPLEWGETNGFLLCTYNHSISARCRPDRFSQDKSCNVQSWDRLYIFLHSWHPRNSELFNHSHLTTISGCIELKNWYNSACTIGDMQRATERKFPQGGIL